MLDRSDFHVIVYPVERKSIAFTFMTEPDAMGRYWFGRPVLMEEQSTSQVDEAPTFELNQTQVQELMDQLWSFGIRPKPKIFIQA